MRCSGSQDKLGYCFELKTGFEVRCLLPVGQKGLSELGSGAGEVQGEEHWLQIGRLSLIVLLELEIRLRVHTCKLEKPSDSGYTHTCTT